MDFEAIYNLAKDKIVLLALGKLGLSIISPWGKFAGAIVGKLLDKFVRPALVQAVALGIKSYREGTEAKKIEELEDAVKQMDADRARAILDSLK